MKAVYAIKCMYTPLLKGVFFALKDFDQSKVYNFTCSPHRISLLFKLRPDFVINFQISFGK